MRKLLERTSHPVGKFEEEFVTLDIFLPFDVFVCMFKRPVDREFVTFLTENSSTDVQMFLSNESSFSRIFSQNNLSF